MSKAAPSQSLIVILRPARGRLKDLGPISQENLAASAPSAGAREQATAFFAARACQIHAGGAAANSFSIEASAKTLAKLFDAGELARLAKTGGDLSLAKLPRDVRELLEAVSFSAPPDFGPTNFA